MSIWSDIHKRSNGLKIRKEDEIKSVVDELSSPITYFGNINSQSINNVKHESGRIYYVNDDCSHNGQQFHVGDLILDDGNGWQVISRNDYLNSYIEQ